MHKKICKALISIELVIMIVMLSISPIYAINFNETGMINIEDLEKYQKTGDIAFNKLNAILADDMQTEKSKYGSFIENYAGSIINDEGKLIVYISSKLSVIDSLQNELSVSDAAKDAVSSKLSVIDSLQNELSASDVAKDDVEFVQVRYSYEELEEQQADMWLFRNQAIENKNGLEEWANKIKSVAINPEHNCVSVLMNDFDDFDYALCEKYFGDYSYEVEATTWNGEIQEQTVTLKPGQSNSIGGSIGFRCKLAGITGFMTTAHTNDYSKINPITYDGNTVGLIRISVYDGNADFSFAKITNSNYTVGLTTNTTPACTLHSSNYVISLATGFTVYLAGSTSTQIRMGQVLYYNYAISSGTQWILCSYSSAGGDSGGCIFAPFNGDYCIIGIHDGRMGGTGNAYGTKLTTMQQYFDITIY